MYEAGDPDSSRTWSHRVVLVVDIELLDKHLSMALSRVSKLMGQTSDCGKKGSRSESVAFKRVGQASQHNAPMVKAMRSVKQLILVST